MKINVKTNEGAGEMVHQVYSTCYSSKDPNLAPSTYIVQLTTACNSLQGIQCHLLASESTALICNYVHRDTYTYVENKTKQVLFLHFWITAETWSADILSFYRLSSFFVGIYWGRKVFGFDEVFCGTLSTGHKIDVNPSSTVTRRWPSRSDVWAVPHLRF